MGLGKIVGPSIVVEDDRRIETEPHRARHDGGEKRDGRSGTGKN